MNRQFPALRGFAIFLVVINHSIVLSLRAISQYQLHKAPLWERSYLLVIKEIGVLAVPIFLFLAGCFMMYSLMNQPIGKAYQLIWPALKHAIIPYLIWSIIYYFVIFFISKEAYSFTGYLKNLIVGYPFNFVPILVFFILISPLLAFIIKKYPVFLLAAVLIYQIVLVNIQLPGILGFTFPQWLNIVSPPVLSLPLTLWAIFYPLGMIYIQHSLNIKNLIKKMLPIIIVISLATFVLAALNELEVIRFTLAEWFLPIAVVWLFPVIDRKKIPLLSFFENLGKRSYGLYFMNLIIINLFVILTAKLIPVLYLSETLVVVMFVAVTLFLSLQLMQWVERGPGRKLYRLIFG